jgi:hypothetical protein
VHDRGEIFCYMFFTYSVIVYLWAVYFTVYFAPLVFVNADQTEISESLTSSLRHSVVFWFRYLQITRISQMLVDTSRDWGRNHSVSSEVVCLVCTVCFRYCNGASTRYVIGTKIFTRIDLIAGYCNIVEKNIVCIDLSAFNSRTSSFRRCHELVKPESVVL